MPNEYWQVICQRGRALREAEGTLSGHAAGDDLAPVLDHSAAVRAIGTGPRLPLRLGRRACRNRWPASLIISTS